ncbi:MAG: energy transducer TonB [Bacteroidales bacterium]|nr:energy transducer TonB [Bacteroidales bacterium]
MVQIKIAIYAQNIENDTIYNCEDLEWRWQPDLRHGSDYKRGTGWRKFIETFAVYPSLAKQKGISGISVVSVVIYKDGSKSIPTIVQSSDSILDAEAIRIVSLMPEFKPSSINIRMLMPIHFYIYDDGKTEITTYDNKHNKQNNNYLGVYFGCILFDGPSEFLDTKPLFNGVLELYGGHIFRNDKQLAFSIGGSVRNCHYSFTKAFSLKYDNNLVYEDTLTRENDKFKRHNLRIINLSVPLGTHLRFQTQKYGKSEISFWLIGNMRIGCRERQVYEIDGTRKKINIKDDFLIRRFNYDLALEYTNHCISAKVTLSPLSLFKKDVSPYVYYFIFSMGFKFGNGQNMQ